MANGPVTDDELSALFGWLESWPTIGLAVSGGADSLALLHLYARWERSLAAPPATLVLTVDHRLRATSKAEADCVAAQATSLGFRHETLVWDGPKPETGVPQAARDARYALMSERLAHEIAAPRALITAHTQDDQAETLLMRLARGSGLAGLAGMRLQRVLSANHTVTLVRPLLGVPKSRLEATLRAAEHAWVNDPTNTDERFERARLRMTQVARDGLGLTNAALALTATRLARADAALNAATDALAVVAVNADPVVLASVDRALFDAAPEELRLRLLDRLLRGFGGTTPAPQLSELEALCERWPYLTGATTLGGCVIEPDGPSMIICREPGRMATESLELLPGGSAIWDGRFRVALAASAQTSCTVRALNASSWAQLRNGCTLLRPVPIRAALTLPSFWARGRLVSVPSLGKLSVKPGCERHMLCIAPLSLLELVGTLCTAAALPPASEHDQA